MQLLTGEILKGMRFPAAECPNLIFLCFRNDFRAFQSNSGVCAIERGRRLPPVRHARTRTHAVRYEFV